MGLTFPSKRPVYANATSVQMMSCDKHIYTTADEAQREPYGSLTWSALQMTLRFCVLRHHEAPSQILHVLKNAAR